MYETDLHAHSLFSGCGLHSIIEILTQAKNCGLKAQAITDHGPYLGRRPSSTFFERLEDPVEGIKMLKGMECNITDESGTIDLVEKFMPWYDVVLLGFHNFEIRDGEPEYYSEVMARAIHKNPSVDIIVHPNAPHYVMDFGKIAETAAETGTAIELNNAKTHWGRSSVEQTEELIRTCMESGCSVVVSTDAHAMNEVADTAAMEKILDRLNFPDERIINRSLESTFEWIKSRKQRRVGLC